MRCCGDIECRRWLTLRRTRGVGPPRCDNDIQKDYLGHQIDSINNYFASYSPHMGDRLHPYTLSFFIFSSFNFFTTSIFSSIFTPNAAKTRDQTADELIMQFQKWIETPAPVQTIPVTKQLLLPENTFF